MLRPDRPLHMPHVPDDELREMATAVHSSNGQRHDRTAGNAVNMAVTQPVGDGSKPASTGDIFEITTSQRMMSAMTGSILTSLLGE